MNPKEIVTIHHVFAFQLGRGASVKERNLVVVEILFLVEINENISRGVTKRLCSPSPFIGSTMPLVTKTSLSLKISSNENLSIRS